MAAGTSPCRSAAIPRQRFRSGRGIEDQRIVGECGAQRGKTTIEFAAQDLREPTRINGRHERHSAARLVLDAVYVDERCFDTWPLALNQLAFDVRQRLECTFDLLGRGQNGPVRNQPIRVLRIGWIEQPGGAELVRGFIRPGYRLQDDPPAGERGAPTIDQKV
jgi:hypothetical protein